MDLTFSFYAASVLAVLITGISKSGFGGGLGVMSVPIMSLFVAPQFAAAVLMPVLLIMDILIVARYRRHWRKVVVFSLLPAAMVGLLVGALVFQHMDADVIRFVVGLLALFFVLQYVFQQTGQAVPGQVSRTGRTAIWALGGISGFASYVAHAGGPPVKGYLLSQNLEKTDFVGTNTVYFFSLNAIKTIAYGSTGTMSLDSLAVSAILVPCLFIGVFLGMRLHHRVDQRLFVKIVYGFLGLTAIRLLSDGAAGLFFAA
ncbi:MAG: sulfite exporter TauE/SafE family protein [Pseudomonadota bacterium]